MKVMEWFQHLWSNEARRVPIIVVTVSLSLLLSLFIKDWISHTLKWNANGDQEQWANSLAFLVLINHWNRLNGNNIKQRNLMPFLPKIPLNLAVLIILCLLPRDWNSTEFCCYQNWRDSRGTHWRTRTWLMQTIFLSTSQTHVYAMWFQANITN